MEKRKETENILNSLDGLLKASPGAFFYTRVQARLQKEETGFWGSLAGFLTKPTVALATLCLIFLLNAAAFLYQKESSYTVAAADQNEQTSADDYNTTLASNTYYDETFEAH
ncbi:MAG: hypothetical protein ABI813_07970 [Bacteroidota bacterium]